MWPLHLLLVIALIDLGVRPSLQMNVIGGTAASLSSDGGVIQAQFPEVLLFSAMCRYAGVSPPEPLACFRRLLDTTAIHTHVINQFNQFE